MKFLVIVALCAYDALAAPPGQYSPWQQTKAVAEASVQPVAKAAYRPYEAANKFGSQLDRKSVFGAVAKSSVVQSGVQGYKSEVSAEVQPGINTNDYTRVKAVEVVKPYTSVSSNAGVKSNVGIKSEAYASSSLGYKKAPEDGNQDQILRYDSEVNPDSFHYFFNTANGIAAESSGTLKKIDDAAAIVVQGFYEYTGPDGTPIRVEYIADENGFQPKSDIIPVAPPLPEAIARSLNYISEHKAYEIEGKKF